MTALGADDGLQDMILKAVERARAAQTMFTVIDRNGEGFVEYEKLGQLLTSMTLSQGLKFSGDMDEFVDQLNIREKINSDGKISFSDFVEHYNSLVDKVKAQQRLQTNTGADQALSEVLSGDARDKGGAASTNPTTGSSPAGTSSDQAESSSQGTTPSGDRPSTAKQRLAAYLVSGAATTEVNGMYALGTSKDKGSCYKFSHFVLQQSEINGARCWTIRDEEIQDPNHYYYFSKSGDEDTDPPINLRWVEAQEGVLPGPVLTPVGNIEQPDVKVSFELFEVGDYVRVNWHGRGVMYPGEIIAVNPDAGSTFDIHYDDGDFESHVPQERIHQVEVELSETFSKYRVGDFVRGNWKGHGSWYSGRVCAINPKYRVFTLHYDDGNIEKHVPTSRIQLRVMDKFKSDYLMGSKVQGNWRGRGTWYQGKVIAANRDDGTYDVQYEHGYFERRVPVDRMQVAEEDSSAEAAEEEEVTATPSSPTHHCQSPSRPRRGHRGIWYLGQQHMQYMGNQHYLGSELNGYANSYAIGYALQPPPSSSTTSYPSTLYGPPTVPTVAGPPAVANAAPQPYPAPEQMPDLSEMSEMETVYQPLSPLESLQVTEGRHDRVPPPNNQLSPTYPSNQLSPPTALSPPCTTGF